MKRFYVNVLGLVFVQGKKGKLAFIKAGKSILLIFNPDKTCADNERQRTA